MPQIHHTSCAHNILYYLLRRHHSFATMATNGSELCFGLVLLLEAAEYHNVNLVTPPCTKRKVITTASSQPLPLFSMKPVYSKLVSFSLPPKKRIKLDFGDGSGGTWLRSNPRSPSNVIKFSPIKKSSKCSGGSAYCVWERTGECAMAATLARRFNSLDAIK